MMYIRVILNVTNFLLCILVALKWQLSNEKHFKKIFTGIKEEMSWLSGFGVGERRGTEGKLVVLGFFLGTSMCYGQIMSLRS